ncbi:MAG: hypothetical protein OSB42_08180 [Planctomycetota bacterium]|nr:hypothetical protein [Planctomycetota bacterium]
MQLLAALADYTAQAFRVVAERGCMRERMCIWVDGIQHESLGGKVSPAAEVM